MALTLRDYFPHCCYFTNRLLASFLHKNKQTKTHTKTGSFAQQNPCPHFPDVVIKSHFNSSLLASYMGWRWGTQPIPPAVCSLQQLFLIFQQFIQWLRRTRGIQSQAASIACGDLLEWMVWPLFRWATSAAAYLWMTKSVTLLPVSW